MFMYMCIYVYICIAKYKRTLAIAVVGDIIKKYMF